MLEFNKSSAIHPTSPQHIEEAIYPQTFAGSQHANPYLADPATRQLLEFFEGKGLPALKAEDRREQWYDDWLAYQAQHRIYASVLSPAKYSNFGGRLDLLRLTRFMEVFAYCSAGHGYSLQVTFLGLFSILMGDNEELKRQAVRTLEAGGLLAFGVSEKDHGSDLLGNEFTVTPTGSGRLIANGRKFYIGNANCASIVSILARKVDARTDGRVRRAPFVLFALRPKESPAYQEPTKIRTLGVRSGFVGDFEVRNHELTDADVIAESRRAWDAVLGTVTLGKFFLGFAAVGICEHALAEATSHLNRRMLYGKSALQMTHLQSLCSQAYARLTAMKLYAYRALDYAHAASEADRRHLLYTAVQKAKVSTEGVKVMALLSEAIGAKGFESDTFFEMALRDTQLIPGLEGSVHINLAQTIHFIPAYFTDDRTEIDDPPSLVGGETESRENNYLMAARVGSPQTVCFARFASAFEPLRAIGNVKLFVRQAKAFRLFLRGRNIRRLDVTDTELALAIAKCFATIAYAQLIAENATRLAIPAQIISAIFQLLVNDLSEAAAQLATVPRQDAVSRALAERMVTIPRTSQSSWHYVADRITRTAASASAI